MDPLSDLPKQNLPVNLERLDPDQLQQTLETLSVKDQCRAVLSLKGKDRLNLLYLSPKGVEVVRALPLEELFVMVHELGKEECLPILSVMDTDQLQYFFDLEWWQGDKFVPERALEWINLLDQCQDPQVLNWFLSEELETKVMVLQSLIRVHEKDQEPFAGMDQMPFFTVDGVYTIYVKAAEAEPALKRFFMLLRESFPNVYFHLVQSVLGYPLTPTVERAYHWRLTRTEARGIPDYQEALEVYSMLDPKNLQEPVATTDDFSQDGRYPVAPTFPLTQTRESGFLGQCLGLLQDEDRFETIRWEWVYLANKVMMADKLDPSEPDNLKQAMNKVLGFTNIGLELGAGGDAVKGEKLLERSWMQSLFQVGYGRLMKLRWEAQVLVKDQGGLLNQLLGDIGKDQLSALVQPTPKLGRYAEHAREFQWQDFESLKEVEQADGFLSRIRFQARFAIHCLNLSEKRISEIRSECDPLLMNGDIEFMHWVATALARFTLFEEISCEPLTPHSAKPFLETIFLKSVDVNPDEGREVDRSLVQAFHHRLLEIPMAWTEDDRASLTLILEECAELLKTQLGRIDPKQPIEWKYLRGLLLKS